MNWFASLLLIFIFLILPCQGQDQPSLKPAVPQLDSVAPQQAPAPKPAKTAPQPSQLKGGVQRSVRTPTTMHYLNPAKEDWDRFLHGDARDQNPSLNGSAQSGVGIIGVKFVLSMGRPPVINRVFPRTPAAVAGIVPNDIIVAVDGIPTLGLTKEEVYDMIVGLPGTQVTISVKRGDEYQSQTMTRMDLNDITDPYVRRDYLTHM